MTSSHCTLDLLIYLFFGLFTITIGHGCGHIGCSHMCGGHIGCNTHARQMQCACVLVAKGHMRMAKGHAHQAICEVAQHKHFWGSQSLGFLLRVWGINSQRAVEGY